MRPIIFNNKYCLTLILINIILLPAAAMAIVTPSMSPFPIPGGQYDSTNATGYATIQTEMISLSLTSRLGGPPLSLPSPGQTTRVDSFFDVFTEISLDGGTDYTVDSFFDIWTEISITGKDDGPGGIRTFDTEMLSLSLAGGPSGLKLRESPSKPTYGHVTVLKLTDDTDQVDSFFDVWTEISFDGGQTWSPADSPIHVELTTITPEPTSLMLLALGGMVLRMKKRPVC